MRHEKIIKRLREIFEFVFRSKRYKGNLKAEQYRREQEIINKLELEFVDKIRQLHHEREHNYISLSNDAAIEVLNAPTVDPIVDLMASPCPCPRSAIFESVRLDLKYLTTTPYSSERVSMAHLKSQAALNLAKELIAQDFLETRFSEDGQHVRFQIKTYS